MTVKLKGNEKYRNKGDIRRTKEEKGKQGAQEKKRKEKKKKEKKSKEKK